MGNLNTPPKPKFWIWFSLLIASALAWLPNLSLGINPTVPHYIECTGTPPRYTVEWMISGPFGPVAVNSPAEVARGTLVTPKVTFTDGSYVPGHWSHWPVPATQVWPWIGEGSFSQAARINRNPTSFLVWIRGKYKATMCSPTEVTIDEATTVTGVFHPAGGHIPNDPGDGGPLDDADYYDPGNQEPPVSTPPFLPWPPVTLYPADDNDTDGEIHGEVNLDAPPASYKLLGYTNYPKRGNIPTLCQAPIIIKPLPPGGGPAEEQVVDLSLSIISVNTSETPIDAVLVLQPGDPAIADADYEIRSEHNGQTSAVITTWPYTTSPADRWQNYNPGNIVYHCSPAKSSKLKIRPKIPNPRALSFFVKYQPIKPASSLVTYQAKRVTQLDLLPLEDSDGDTISDTEELLAGLDPLLVDSDGDGALDIHEDSDGDGIINLHEIANSSYIHKPDTDGDIRLDGDDWMETVDAEGARQEVLFPYDIIDPMAAHPSPAEQVQFQATLTATAPAYDGRFLPSTLQTVPGNARDAGSVILAERRHRIYDLNDKWLQIGEYLKSYYRLRTGHAAAGTATGPNADPDAQNENVPILIHRASYAGNGFAPGAVPVEETFEFQHFSLSNGVVSITAAPPPLPSDLAHYTFPNGEVGYHYVETATKNAIRLEVDTNMDGVLRYPAEGTQAEEGDVFTDGAPDFTKTAKEVNTEKALQKAGDAGLILDINNNNSDSGDKYDHLSLPLDGAKDFNEFSIGKKPGHTSGGGFITVKASTLSAMKSRAGFPDGQYRLRLVSAGGNCLRVHRGLGENLQLILGVGAENSVRIMPEWIKDGKLPIVIEGVRHGSDTLTQELVRATESGDDEYEEGELEKVELSDIVKVQVNVDQVPDSTLTNRDAIQLGKAATNGFTSTKHYVGADFNAGSIIANNTATIIALRGIMKAEIPANNRGGAGAFGWRPWLTHKGGRLRSGYENNAWESTASFWIGLTGIDPQDNYAKPATWAQMGILLTQDPGQEAPNHGRYKYQPLFYLESGRFSGFYPAHSQKKLKPDETNNVFEDWETKGLHFGFVMYEQRESAGSSGSGVPDNFTSWKVVLHDLRTENSQNYVSTVQGYPQLPVGSAGGLVRAMQNRAIHQKLQVKMEFHNSQSFLFGKTNHEASIEEVQFATERNAGGKLVDPGGAKEDWGWATGSTHNDAKFNWREATEIGKTATTNLTVNQGLRPESLAAVNSNGGEKSSGFWHLKTEITPITGKQKFLFWDTRAWGFFPRSP